MDCQPGKLLALPPGDCQPDKKDSSCKPFDELLVLLRAEHRHLQNENALLKAKLHADTPNGGEVRGENLLSPTWEGFGVSSGRKNLSWLPPPALTSDRELSDLESSQHKHSNGVRISKGSKSNSSLGSGSKASSKRRVSTPPHSPPRSPETHASPPPLELGASTQTTRRGSSQVESFAPMSLTTGPGPSVKNLPSEAIAPRLSPALVPVASMPWIPRGSDDAFAPRSPSPDMHAASTTATSGAFALPAAAAPGWRTAILSTCPDGPLRADGLPLRTSDKSLGSPGNRISVRGIRTDTPGTTMTEGGIKGSDSKESTGSKKTVTSSIWAPIVGSLSSIAAVANAEVLHVSEAARNPSYRKVWEALNDPGSSCEAQFYHVLMPTVNIFSMLLSLFQTVPGDRLLTGTPLMVIEYVFEALYVLDFVARLVTCPNRSKFVRSHFNKVDILGLLTLPVRIQFRTAMANGATDLAVQEYILFCVVPILRLLKTLRHFELLLLLVGAFQEAFKALPVLIFVWLLFTLFFSVLVYGVEDRDDIVSLPHAMWFVMVTASTVGYGDMVPKTIAGSLIISVTIISGVLYMAVPIGLISQIFGDQWKARHRILFVNRLHTRLKLNDFGPYATEMFFSSFDDDGSGQVDATEWRAMMVHLGMDLRNTGRLCGFQYFSGGDNSVGINYKQFVRVLWPDLYPEVFRKAKGQRTISLFARGRENEDVEEEEEEEFRTSQTTASGPFAVGSSVESDMSA